MRKKMVMSVVAAITMVCQMAPGEVVRDFSTVADGYFVDLPADNVIQTISVGMFTITPDLTLGRGAFWGGQPGDDVTPGDSAGFIVGTGHPYMAPYLVLEFNKPLSGFGVTFYHMANFFGAGLELPGILDVYDGEGHLIRSEHSVGWDGISASGNASFVGVWNEDADIYGAVLRGNRNQMYAVDGYGFSYADGSFSYPPGLVPEPSVGFILFGGILMGMFFFTLTNRKNKVN